MKRLVAALILAIPVTAWCQAPVISSFENAASYQPTLTYVGAIATIFGTSLANATASAKAFPLPLTLGGTAVMVGGVAAPLFYVSPTQINFQVPGDGSIVVSTAAGNSAPYAPATATPNAWDAGGIFTVNSSGCGQGAVLNVAANGSVSANSSGNSASAGDWISVYGTGIAEVGNPPIGVPAPSSPPLAQVGVGVELEFDLAGNYDAAGNYIGASSSWVGLAPGFVGLDQANFQVPTTTRQGCAVPIQVFYQTRSTALTAPVTMAIHSGHGQCVDPPPAGYGRITWQKAVNTTDQGVASETDTIIASLQSSPGKTAPPAPVYADGCPPPSHACVNNLPNSQTYFGPACAVPGYRSLDAGAVTIQGPGFGPAPLPALPFQEGQLGGLSAYQATLPAGTVQAGDFTVAAGGGGDAGAFQASLKIGADIQIQTALDGIVVSFNCSPLTINWTGGDPGSWVTVRFVQFVPSAFGGYQFVNVGYQTRASYGTMTIPPVTLPDIGCGVQPPEPIMLTIEVDPDPSEITTFSAPGLSLGGKATWKYIHTFTASLVL